MAMQISTDSKDDDMMMEINTTPLIDVMLVLLVMLIITIPVQTHAVKLDMPSGVPPTMPQPPPEVITLDVDFDGTLLWNGTVLADQASLESRLIAAAHQTVQPEFHLRPHKLVTYRHVVAVLAAAQRLGLNKIGIIGHEQFLE